MIFLHNKRERKLLNIILMTKDCHTGFKPGTAIHTCDTDCEGREEHSKNSNRRYQCLYPLLSRKQPSAVGGLRQSRSSCDDPCLKNANKVQPREFSVWNESVFI